MCSSRSGWPVLNPSTSGFIMDDGALLRKGEGEGGRGKGGCGEGGGETEGFMDGGVGRGECVPVVRS